MLRESWDGRNIMETSISPSKKVKFITAIDQNGEFNLNTHDSDNDHEEVKDIIRENSIDKSKVDREYV